MKNTQGDRLGKVKDFALDLQSGRLAYVGISREGEENKANNLVAIPDQEIRPRDQKYKL